MPPLLSVSNFTVSQTVTCRERAHRLERWLLCTDKLQHQCNDSGSSGSKSISTVSFKKGPHVIRFFGGKTLVVV